MIEAYIVSKLDTIPALSGQIFPAAAPVGECTPPFSIYTPMRRTPNRDMQGEIVFYSDTIRVDFYHDDFDSLCDLTAAAEKVLWAENEDQGELYVFSCRASGGDPDGFDLNLEMHRKTLIVSAQYWR